MLVNFIRGVSYICAFYLGRLSYMWWRNKHLDMKIEEAKNYAMKANDLLQQAKDKETEVRKKWQRMVSDISQYQFSGLSNKDEWTDLDQLYLESWKSAES